MLVITCNGSILAMIIFLIIIIFILINHKVQRYRDIHTYSNENKLIYNNILYTNIHTHRHTLTIVKYTHTHISVCTEYTKWGLCYCLENK